MQMLYTSYWSILDSPSHTIKSSNICLIIAISFLILWVLTKRFQQDNSNGEKQILLWGTGVLSVLGTMAYFALTFIYTNNVDAPLLKMLNSSTVPKVEGLVTNFQRTYRNTRYGTETIESFTVDSVQFAYGDAVVAKFDSFSETNNGMIYEGRPVRVTYCHGSPYGAHFNSILKLELGQ